jgi:hypothetical protein
MSAEAAERRMYAPGQEDQLVELVKFCIKLCAEAVD